jgi:hypothetical protein
MYFALLFHHIMMQTCRFSGPQIEELKHLLDFALQSPIPKSRLEIQYEISRGYGSH